MRYFSAEDDAGYEGKKKSPAFRRSPLTPDHEPAEKQKIRNTEQSSASSIMRRVKEKMQIIQKKFANCAEVRYIY